MAQVHRFKDNVAVYIGQSTTVYLSPKTAKAIAKALNTCARDIAARNFTESQFRSTTIEESK